MIKIGIKENRGQFEPILKIDEEMNLDITSASILLFWLENGVYSEKLRNIIDKKITPEQKVRIDNFLENLYEAKRINEDQNFIPPELVEALTPIIPAELDNFK